MLSSTSPSRQIFSSAWFQSCVVPNLSMVIVVGEKAGANPTSTRLRQAIISNDIPLVERLLRTNPHLLHNPDFENKSNTSLHLAAQAGHHELVVSLLILLRSWSHTDHDVHWAHPSHIDESWLRIYSYNTKTNFHKQQLISQHRNFSYLLVTTLPQKSQTTFTALQPTILAPQ